MKKIINGKVYDTETAQKVAYWGNGLGYSDINWREESLHRKKTGEFFLHGEGGPRTNYAERVGNMWSSGERIMPLSYDEARQWAEEHLDGDEYEAIFGAVSEDESRVHVHYSISAAAAAKATRRAGELGLTVSAYIEQLITAG